MDKSLSSKIFISLFTGLILGSIVQYGFGAGSFLDTYFVGTATAVGTMFVSLIKLMVVPLVFISIVCGVCELKDIKSLGRLGGKTFFLYLINTAVAITAALIVAMIVQPGVGANLAELGGNAVTLTSTETPNIGQLIVNIVPSNPVQAFASGDMLQIIFMAIITGLAIQALDTKGGPAVNAFKIANDIMMKLVSLIMSFAPIGVFALMIQLGATLNSTTLMSVAGYVGLVVSLLVVWIVLVYPLAVWAFTGVRPAVFRRQIREQFLFSLSTASSNATIPVTMRTLTEKIGVSKTVAGFGVPLGATMNMSGVSIYITLATVFAANAYGTPFAVADLFTLGLTVLLLSVGAGGVPGGGIVMVGVLLTQLGLPVEALAIVAAVDRVCDMFCTSANVIGDTAVNTIVAKSEGELDLAKLEETDKAAADMKKAA